MGSLISQVIYILDYSISALEKKGPPQLSLAVQKTVGKKNAQGVAGDDEHFRQRLPGDDLRCVSCTVERRLGGEWLWVVVGLAGWRAGGLGQFVVSGSRLCGQVG
eukprot:COSAG02_NODE_9880_length_2084_cov_3.531990_2_plen_105_part_00